MCSKLLSKKSVHFSSLGCHATYAHAVVSPRHIEAIAKEHDFKMVVVVIENHADGEPHTHIVWYAFEKVLWNAKLFSEVAPGPHLTRLRTERDVMVCCSYLCKEFTPHVWVHPKASPSRMKEQILHCLWARNHNPRYPNSASLVYEEAYERCRLAWFPPGESQPSQEMVASEDPDKYFK